MHEDPSPPPLSAAALIGWGMGLMGVGLTLLVVNLMRTESAESTASSIVALVVIGVGWVLLTIGITRLARRLDRLSHARQDAHVPAP